MSCHSSSSTKTLLPSSKLTQSYYHHESDIPILYHTLGQHLEKLAHTNPNHECYVFKSEGNKRYTYKTFFDEVDSLATSLIELGFEKGDRIGVWLPNTSEMCALSYATSRAGLIKVNISPVYVEREITYCINKVGCKGLVLRPNVQTTDCLKILRRIAPELDEMKGELNSKSLPTLKHIILTAGDYEKGSETFNRIPKGMHLYSDLIRKGAGHSHKELHDRQAQLDGNTPTAIFFTSGTTGESKAVTLTNSNLLNNSCNLSYTHPTLLSRVCCPVSAVHLFGELYGTLNINTSGYFTALPGILPDPIEEMRTIQEEKCTALTGPPVIFLNILHHPKKKEYDMSSLLLGITGAAPVNSDMMEQLEREIPIKTMCQAYGQSENTGPLSLSIFGDADEQHRFTSIGIPVPHMEIKIVDDNGCILPIGEEGEIYAHGCCIMKGYYGDEEKTRETITSDGWLKTGDLGVMDDKGYVYYRSRDKDLIIVNGINVYPIEIENLLLEHPNIIDAQVFGIPDETCGEVICAWIKVKPNTKINDVEEVKQFLEDKVTFLKVPKYVKVIESFAPFMTPIGKVQKFKMAEAMVKELSKSSL